MDTSVSLSQEDLKIVKSYVKKLIKYFKLNPGKHTGVRGTNDFTRYENNFVRDENTAKYSHLRHLKQDKL